MIEDSQDFAAYVDRLTSSIDAGEIEHEMYRIHADIAFTNARYAAAHRDYLLAKLAAEREEAAQYIAIRETLEISGARFTEAVITSKIRVTDGYHQAKLALIAADVEREHRKGLAFALHAKKDMLVSIGMRINAEMRLDPLAAANAKRDRETREMIDPG
jgi:hypothetical protein